VDVLEDEQGGRVEHLAEQRPDHAVEPRAAEGGVEVVHLGRRLDLHVERCPEQRSPGHELAVDGREPFGEDGAVVLAAAVELHVEERTEERPEGVVRRGRLVLLAAERDLLHVATVLAQFVGQTRLADARLADQLDHRSEAHAHRLDGRAEHRTLALAVDEGELLGAGLLVRFRPELTEGDRSLRLGLSLELERLERGRVERGSASLVGRRRHPDLVLRSLRHQARREGRGVAENRVRAPERRPDLAGEDASLADADVNREGESGVDDRPHRAEQPLLVVPERLRRAGDEDDSPAVTVDVALEERHLMVVRRLLDRPCEHLDRIGRRVRPLGRDDLVRARVADEGDRGVTMLPLERPDLEQLGAQRRGHGDLDRKPVEVGQRLELTRHFRRRLQKSALAFLVPEGRRVELGGRLPADEDLAGFGGGLHLHRSACGRPGDEQFPMGVADEEELEAAGVEAGMHPQLDGSRRRARTPDRPQRPPHLERRPRRTLGVPVALVEEQERVAAELEQAAAERVGPVEERRERRVHHVRHFLGARAPAARELLRHRREARDVDEGESPVDLEPAPLRARPQPLDRQPRNERDELGRAVGSVAVGRRHRGERASITREHRARSPAPPAR
jgi:hypothetical protein